MALAFFSLPKIGAAVDATANIECDVGPNPGQCICHGTAGETCPSESGVVNGHDDHLAKFCCNNFGNNQGAAPDFCNFPDLDCACVQPNGVQDTFGKCNGCGDGNIDNNPGCCDPDDDPVNCTDPDNFCEECDDSNNLNEDGCDENCQLEHCPDGNIDAGEQCDGAELGSCQFGCTDDCQCGTCGDGVLDPGEECDPGIDQCCNDDCTVNNGDSCDPDSLCTDDGTCSNGVCLPINTDCNDENDCTIDDCDEGGEGCTHTPSNDLCSDQMFCNGDEVCDPGNQNADSHGCVPGTPPDTSDGVECTNDTCDELNHIVHQPDDTICDNGSFCDGEEFCDPEDGCLSADNPPNCNDDIQCTIDSCSDAGEGSCIHTPDTTSEGCQPPCPDQDNDGVCDDVDNCPTTPNSNQADNDSDGVGNACDNCINDANPGQADSDEDGTGNACEPPGAEAPQCVDPNAITGSGAGGCGKGQCANLLTGSFDPTVVGIWMSMLMGPTAIAGLIRRRRK